MDYIIIDNIDQINFFECYSGNVLALGNNLLAPLANIYIMEKDEKKNSFLNYHEKSYLSFCFLFISNIETVTFNYDLKHLLNENSPKCLYFENIFTGHGAEFWASYESVKLIIPSNSKFLKLPQTYSRKECYDEIINNPITENIISLIR